MRRGPMVCLKHGFLDGRQIATTQACSSPVWSSSGRIRFLLGRNGRKVIVFSPKQRLRLRVLYNFSNGQVSASLAPKSVARDCRVPVESQSVGSQKSDKKHTVSYHRFVIVGSPAILFHFWAVFLINQFPANPILRSMSVL